MWYPSIFNTSWLKLPGIYLCLILITRQDACAQESGDNDPQKWTLNAGILFNKTRVIDKTFSSIPYSGNNWGASLSIKLQKKRSFHELQGYYTKGALQAVSSSADKLSQTYVNADYAWLYRVGSNSHSLFTFKTGAGINVLYAKREYSHFINNNESFEFVTSLSGIFEASYFFRNKFEGFSISNRICLPFVSFITQPEFGSEDTPGSFGKNSQVTAFSSFLRLLNFLSLEKKLSNRQKLSFSYTWDYYQILRAREVKQVTHKLGLTYSFII